MCAISYTIAIDLCLGRCVCAHARVYLDLFPIGVILCPKCLALQVRWSSVVDSSLPDPPTAVFLHGILGGRKNWGQYSDFISAIADLKSPLKFIPKQKEIKRTCLLIILYQCQQLGLGVTFALFFCWWRKGSLFSSVSFVHILLVSSCT